MRDPLGSCHAAQLSAAWPVARKARCLRRARYSLLAWESTGRQSEPFRAQGKPLEPGVASDYTSPAYRNLGAAALLRTSSTLLVFGEQCSLNVGGGWLWVVKHIALAAVCCPDTRARAPGVYCWQCGVVVETACCGEALTGCSTRLSPPCRQPPPLQPAWWVQSSCQSAVWTCQSCKACDHHFASFPTQSLAFGALSDPAQASSARLLAAFFSPAVSASPTAVAAAAAAGAMTSVTSSKSGEQNVKIVTVSKRPGCERERGREPRQPGG